ncbi:MAG: DNA gyrase subunit A [Chloroflexi bacterium]|nr:DNA gyrase subunit A [Chloroflexota bacterium]
MAEAQDRLRDIRIEEEMRSSYLDYAMSVIVARALPDVRDGLKPVHRRILYAMDELGLRPNRPYKKSARIVGEVLGKYHPHGDSSVYDSLVRMAQDFSMRYPLVDGQGNFGSVDNDPPAAMRYTEVRLAAIAEEMLADIDRDTVDYAPNFDDSLREPLVLPARLPNLLVNGSAGIAVGMATNIPPHNLSEICDAITHLIDNPEATVEDLLRVVHGPDFPTGGTILGREGIRQAFASGKGRVTVQAKAHIEEMARGGRYQIVVTELPYQVNKASLVERIADLVREKKIEGISELRDESDRQGMRVVFELKREAQPRQVLNALYKHSAMRSAFHINMLALVDGQPRVLGLKQAVLHFVDFRRTVIRRRSEYDLKKAQERAHILEGLKIALDHLDEVIQTIRRSESAETARTNLRRRFQLTEVQANAILDMQLRRLARLERRKIEEELAEILKTIAYLEDLLANPAKIDFLVKEESADLKKKYGGPRRTQISEEEAAELTDADLIAHQEVVVTLSLRGYVKRVPADTYRNQRRGGRGITGMVTREQDAVYRLLVADTHDSLLVFTDRGKVYQLRCYEVPDVSRQARGLPLIHLVNLGQDEHVTELVRVENFAAADFLIMATKMGEVKKTPIEEFAQVRNAGLITMNLEPGDELVAARVARTGNDLILVSSNAQAIRFPVDSLRSASRQSGGVRGIRLEPGASVMAMDVVAPGADLLVVSANGFGKRTGLAGFPRHARGGSGVIAMRMNERNGPLVAARVVWPLQELMLISQRGIVIRTSVESISRLSRATQGVTVMRVEPEDRVVSIACFNGGHGGGATQLELPTAPPPPRGGGRRRTSPPETPTPS